MPHVDWDGKEGQNSGQWLRTPMSFFLYLFCLFMLIFEGVPKPSGFHKNHRKSSSMSSVFCCFSMPPGVKCVSVMFLGGHCET